MSYRTTEIGLPFYDDINKQIRNRPYFHYYSSDWLTKENRLPPFQFLNNDSKAVITFNLVNVDTGVSVDYMTYFTNNVTIEVVDGTTYHLHWGNTDVTLSVGRYYFYAASSGREWWSEVFTVCEGTEVSGKLLINDSGDYLLINATDNLLIS